MEKSEKDEKAGFNLVFLAFSYFLCAPVNQAKNFKNNPLCAKPYEIINYRGIVSLINLYRTVQVNQIQV
jgi:hypothetical protein